MNECTIVFIVTKDCQLSCKYCYLVAKKSGEEMTISVAQSVINYILSTSFLVKGTTIIYDFIGGEPLLKINLISEIMDYAVNEMKKSNLGLKFKIRITTNGILYNNSKVQSFIQKYHDHLIISISIDGTKKKNDLNRVFKNGKGSYDSIISNVYLWHLQFPFIGTRMTISHDDIPFVYESVKHLITLGIKKIDVNPVLENVWQEGDEVIYEEQLMNIADYIIDNDLYFDKELDLTCFDEYIGKPLGKKDMINPCGSMFLSVDSLGRFYTCMRFAKYSLRSKKPRIIGDIHNGIDKNKLRPLYALDLQSLYTSECFFCEVATGCKWCPAENYDSSSTGTIYERSVATCNMHKARVRAKNYYWNKIYQKNKWIE